MPVSPTAKRKRRFSPKNSVRPEKSAIFSGCESRPANRSLGRKQPSQRRGRYPRGAGVAEKEPNWVLGDTISKQPAGSLIRLRRNMCSTLTAITGTIERQINKKTSEEPSTHADAELLWQIWAQPPKATLSTRLNPLSQTGVLGQIIVSVDSVATGCHPLIIADRDDKPESACSPVVAN